MVTWCPNHRFNSVCSCRPPSAIRSEEGWWPTNWFEAECSYDVDRGSERLRNSYHVKKTWHTWMMTRLWLRTLVISTWEVLLCHCWVGRLYKGIAGGPWERHGLEREYSTIATAQCHTIQMCVQHIKVGNFWAPSTKKQNAPLCLSLFLFDVVVEYVTLRVRI